VVRNPKCGSNDPNNLSFDGAVAFEVPVMSANSHNVSFEGAENRKAWEQADLRPTMINTQIRENLPATFRVFFQKTLG